MQQNTKNDYKRGRGGWHLLGWTPWWWGGGSGWAISTKCNCSKWSKDALNGQYFLKFTQFQERNWKFSEKYLKNSLIFHSHSCRVHSCRFFFVFFGRPPKISSKLDRIGNSGTKLDRVRQNLGQNHLMYIEMRWKLRKMGWVNVFWWSNPLSTWH